MKKSDQAGTGDKVNGSTSDNRKERLAKALRRNLVLRKERIRAGAQTAAESGTDGERADKA